MNIKSLLLGSAAALVAVSGARAADVIMVEPEPVEYVRVCDVYGAGFFYLPGTETCLRISGQVRLQINVAGDPAQNLEGDDYNVASRVRARLNFDVREETELGLLRAFARIQAQNTSGANNGVDVTQGYVQLGGLLLGYRDSLWTNDIGGIEDGLLTDTDLIAGDFSQNQISYTFAAGGFSATVGLEDDGTGDAVPDVHGKLVYSGAWGGAFVSAVYDETVNAGFGTFGTSFAEDEFNSGNLPGGVNFPFFGGFDLPSLLDDGSNEAFAIKAGLKLRDLLVADSTLAIEGHWASDPTPYAGMGGILVGVPAGVIGGTAFGGGNVNVPLIAEWAIGAGYRQQVSDFSVAVAGQYGELFDTSLTFVSPGATFETAAFGGDFYRLVGNVGYNFTNNFGVLAEVAYTDVSFETIDGVDLGSSDQTTGFLRFARNF
ncbi:porin [Aureimonas populi]|uniref:Porin n=1 Tax=Aureimonas populi TaxID=1701758 RepID=A0ABW5CJ13_9HYPH|nr:porin [Aureimonas populi]